MEALQNSRVALIGGGMMAEALIRGILGKGLVPPEQVIASDPMPERRAHLSDALGIQTTDSNTAAIAGAGIIILAVKPQTIGKVFAELSGQVQQNVLLLSIVTGIKIEAIRQALAVPAIVRIMPNTPGQIGEGMSAWTATPETSPEQREQARAIVRALGEEVYVEDEHYVNMATALSGSGPAYVFLILEALIDAGVQLGFARPVAEKLVLQTVKGAVVYAQQSGVHPAVLRNMVTSPGGTTAEALYQLEKGGLRSTLSRAVWAAYQKAEHLGSLDKE
jgi:pyrroline-5-carboxylate reductase